LSVIEIKSNVRNYKVVFGSVKNYLAKLRISEKTTYYIIDHNVWRIYKKSFLKINRNKIIILPVSEEKKNLDSVQRLYGKFIKFSAKRNVTIVSIGGGITQDITGFLASTLYRGVKWIFIPTTLLAQADSCIGSKTSLNYKSFKNMIGTFYPPFELFVDTDFIYTQKRIDFYSGLGEVIKLHIMGGKKYFNFILRAVLDISCSHKLKPAIVNSLLIKKSYIEEDEFDGGRRNFLNYGHCFGHALENTSGFGIPHGQAVVIGMALANIVSRNRGLLSKELEANILNKLFFLSIAEKPAKSSFDVKRIILAMRKDKKRTGSDLPLVILKDGFMLEKINNLKETEVRRAMDEFLHILYRSDLNARP
jgi:3-dehydroquinate synthase